MSSGGLRAFVAVKRVVDYAVKVRVNAAKTGVDLSNVKMSMNPFCEIAVEEAVRLKEKKVVSEITAVTIGPKASAETLRTALAMGADNALHLETDLRTDQELQPLAVAKLLAWVTKEKSPDFWILGKQVRGMHGAWWRHWVVCSALRLSRAARAPTSLSLFCRTHSHTHAQTNPNAPNAGH
jgi:electron transfer flavoprotein alpha/beta subunit